MLSGDKVCVVPDSHVQPPGATRALCSPNSKHSRQLCKFNFEDFEPSSHDGYTQLLPCVV